MKTNKEIRAEARTLLGNNLFSEKWLFSDGAKVVSILLSYAAYGSMPLIFAQELFCLLFPKGWLGELCLNVVVLFPILLFFIELMTVYCILRICSAEKISFKNFFKSIFSGSSKRRGRRMNGHRWQLFMLNLSLAGWFVLAVALVFHTFGISLIWFASYSSKCEDVFYNEVSQQCQ